jgi:hypothetical protein
MTARLFMSDIDFSNASRVVNMLDGVSAQDGVTVAQLNSAVEGLAWKDSVRVAGQVNITVASPGTTIDGITMAVNDRVLLKAQTAASENGIYIWNGSAVSMTRALDANTANELEAAVAMVEEGTSAGSSFRQSAVNFTLGSGSVTWTTFGSASSAASTSSSGIVQIATQVEVDAGTDAVKPVTPSTLANAANRKLKFTQLIGDGSATSIAVTHNFGTTAITYSIFQEGGTNDEIQCQVRRTSNNVLTFLFNVVPASNTYRVTVLG